MFGESRMKIILFFMLFALVVNSTKPSFNTEYYVEKLVKEAISENILKLAGNKFLAGGKDLMLNVTDYSINAILFMAQRGLNLNMTFLNDSSNPLPIHIDTQSLNLLIDELKQFPDNLNMSLHVYEDPSIHPVPFVFTDPDGTSLAFTIAFEFSVFNNGTEPSPLIAFALPAKIKIQIQDTDNVISIGVISVVLQDLTIYYDNLGVNTTKLKLSMTNFLKVALAGFKPDLTNIDVLKTINGLTNYNFTFIDAISDYGFNLLHIKE